MYLLRVGSYEVEAVRQVGNHYEFKYGGCIYHGELPSYLCTPMQTDPSTLAKYELATRDNFKNIPNFICIMNGRISLIYRKN